MSGLRATIYFDGGARPTNPGPAGWGAHLVLSDGQELEVSGKMDWATNNEAEYQALFEGLCTALENGVDEVEIIGDSQLVVNHVKGTWNCKKENLKLKLRDILKLLSKFDSWNIRWSSRAGNQIADALSRL